MIAAMRTSEESSTASVEARLLNAPPFGNRSRRPEDRKSTRLNSSHSQISYAVFCLKKKNDTQAVSAVAMNRFALTCHFMRCCCCARLHIDHELSAQIRRRLLPDHLLMATAHAKQRR